MKILRPLSLLVVLCAWSYPCQSQSYVEHYRKGIKALEARKYPMFLEAMRSADSLRPNHPVILYQLAKAYMVNGRSKETVQTLSYRMRFYAAADFLEDSTFAPLKNGNKWVELTKLYETYTKKIKSSSQAFTFEFETYFHPEGIAYQAESGRFIISDIRNGLIYSFAGDGSDRQLVIDLKAHGYWSAMGMAFDSLQPSKVWVATSALPNFSGYQPELEGKSAVLSIDLVSGTIEKSFSLEGPHLWGDLIVARDGTLYVTDSRDPAVYVIDSDRRSLKEFLRNESWWNLQGLALSENQEILYVSDYITGIHRVELNSGRIEPLIPENERLRGTDGLYQIKGRLYLLQNGTEPKRLTTIKLDPQGYGIPETLKVADQALMDLNEPTLGTMAGNHFYYIANSPWPHYDEEQNPIADAWPVFKIFKLDAD